MQHFVIVTGLPASGKTTVAVGVARALGWPHFDKDEFLEQLFDEEGVGDLHWRRGLSKRADLLLQHSALGVAHAVLSSWWCHPKSVGDSGTATGWLDNDAQIEVIELHCVCGAATASNRFLARKRHPGHLDERWSREQLAKSFMEQAALGPLFHKRVIELDTEVSVSPRAIQALADQVLRHTAGA